MADDEQFSLCWNNFNSNLSAGFHESLCRGDLVDVTLAAEGQFVKAHRLVLSVCSPYFRKMFTQMPSNQHAFVFLKDVSHTALKDLIQFMYCGEVNVKQEALPAFISTAEALQIKGLTDSDPPPPPQQQQPTEPAAPAPQTQIHNVSNTPPRARHRTTTRTYKLETVDADEDEQPHHQTQTKAPQTTQIVIQTAAAPSATIGAQQQQLHQVVQGATVQQITSVAAPASSSSAGTVVTTTQKRALRTSGGPNLKRTKNSSTTTTTSTSLADPLDTANEAVSSQPQQITVQTAIVTTAATSDKNQSSTSTETEYIDLPIEIPTKSEPDYTEEAGEAEGADQDGTYGEDDSYGDMRYDDTYFTENEDGGNTTTGGGTSTSATTSKTVIKQQQSSFSDSSFTAAADSGEQTNNDAQDAVVNAKIPKPIRKRGRPKIREDAPPQQKLMEKLDSACRRHPGQPTVYASTTKGAMKLIYDGHHFRYSFRKGQFSIFQCCYKENKEECRVRVVSDQKRVYPLDGEHTHFIQATDKSVTSVSFEPGDAGERVKSPPPIETSKNTKDTSTEFEIEEYMIAVGDEGVDDDDVKEESSNQAFDANDFREKIKKRLQRALLGKKK